MVLVSIQPLTEMSTRCISWGKGGRCVRLTSPPSFAVVMKSGNLNFLEPSGSLQACNGTALPLPFTMIIFILRQTQIYRYCIFGLFNASSCSAVQISHHQVGYGQPKHVVALNKKSIRKLR